MTHPYFNKLIVPCIILASYGLIISILLFCLTTFHTYLIANNETTSEYIRDKYYTWDGNPYNYGSLMENLRYFWLKQDSLVYGNNALEINRRVLQ